MVAVFMVLITLTLIVFGNLSITVSAPTPTIDNMPQLGLSHACEEVFISLAMTASPCIPLPMISIMNPSLASELNPDSYRSVLLGYCNGPFCTKSQVTGLSSYIKTKCSEDLKKPALVTALFLLENYAPFKEMSCVEDSFGGNCLLEYYDTYNNNPADFAYDEICTECSQSLFNTFNKWNHEYSTFFNATYFNQLGDICQFTYTKFAKTSVTHN